MADDFELKEGNLGFWDSGAPPNCKNYTTFVIVHGFTWHGGVFRKFLPMASKHNCRVFLVNRRDYPGSKSYEPKDLDLLRQPSPDTEAGFRQFLRDRAIEFAEFLKWIIDEHKIPERKAVEQSGGLVIVGWSLGNHWPLTLLANLDLLNPAIVERLEPYLHRMFLYEPPFHVFGHTPPQEQYNPIFDPTLPPGVGVQLFARWVSGYYKHDLDTGEDDHDPTTLEYRTPLQTPVPSILRMRPRDIVENSHVVPGGPNGSDDLFLEGIKLSVFREQTEKALLTNGRNLDIWPKLEIRYLWCDHSVWEMPWAAWNLQDDIEDVLEEGGHLRPLKFVRLEGLNHFAHWDEPERVLRAFMRTARD